MLRLLPYFCCLCAVGCAPQKPDPKNDKHDGSAPLIILEGEEISLNEFNRRIDALPDFAAARLTTIEEKRAYLAAVAQFEVLAHYAAKKGFDKDPFVVSQTLRAIRKSQALASHKIIQVTPEDILEEEKKQTTIVHYGLKLNAYPCAFEKESKQTPANLLDYGDLHDLDVVNFSTRLPDPTFEKEQRALSNLSAVGALVRLHKPTHSDKPESCDFILLTKIEQTKPDSIEIKNEIRAAKWKVYLDTFK